MRELRWRIIRSGPGDAAWNMALDEAISLNCRENRSPPTLRFYGWQQSALTIGRFQKPGFPSGKPLNPNQTEDIQEDIQIVRRITGGRAVRHGGDLTYSLSAGLEQNEIPPRPREGFLTVARLIKEAFHQFKIELEWGEPEASSRMDHPDCFARTAPFELLFGGEKILGCAQKRWTNGFLQQGSIRLEPFRTCLGGKRFLGFDKILSLKIMAIFEKSFGISFSPLDLTPNEWDLALKLEKIKYRNPAWNLRGNPLLI